MAKLKAPLMSLGAAQKLGNALVFFGWKGLDCVREYVIPANPRTTAQTTQRGYLTAAVTAIHTAQAAATNPLTATDISAYALWGSIFATPRTWFNQIVKNFIDQAVAGLSAAIHKSGTTTPGANSLAVSIHKLGGQHTAGDFWYGTSKTALIHSQVGVYAANNITATIAGLTSGVKYYWQFRPTAPAGYVGNYSGIYYGVAA